MSLTEPQIARFGRQILLTPVGGEGQLRLLQAAAAVVGDGLTMSTAAAYLVAGGTPVSAEAQASGFPLHRQLGQTHAPIAGTIAFAGHRRWGPGHRVAVGSKAVVAMADGGCVRCFEATVAGLEPNADDVESGALAALAWQRLVLQLGDSFAAFNVPLIRCGEHA